MSMDADDMSKHRWSMERFGWGDRLAHLTSRDLRRWREVGEWRVEEWGVEEAVAASLGV
jgi:hypothetical protein